jgi:EmrB/QacA subfamily drug resistance transporter
MPASGEGGGDVERCLVGSGRAAPEAGSESSESSHAASATASAITARTARITARGILGALPVTMPAMAAEDRRRWMALYVLCVGMLMIVLDATIVNVALPTIQEDLGFSQNDLAWVVNAYLIAFGGLLLLAGRIGDLIGQRRIFLIGLAVFTGASLLCALAQSQGLLIGARFVQGVGGALTSAVILGMIVTMFPEPREQAKAIGVYTFVAVAGGSIGLLLGGVLTQAINWHWIFFVNLPIGLATALFAIRLVPDREGIGLTAGADLPGAALLTGGLMLGVYTILGVAEEGWGSSQTLALGAVSIGLLAAFVARQARVANPLMPLRLFRSRNVAGANVVQALLVVGMFGMFFLGALYMQRILGYDALQVGLAYLPLTVVMGTMSFRFTGQLNLRFGPQATLVPAMVFVAAGLLLLARTPVDATYVIDLLPAMILIGLGAGLGFPSLMTLAMSGATASDSGLASGLVNTSVQVGGAIGLAVLATFATERTDGLLADGEPAASALNSGYHLAYLIGAGLVIVAIAIAVTVLRARLPEAPAEAVTVAAAEAVEPPLIQARPVPNYIVGGGCEEIGMRVVIGCGGCTATAP